MKNLLLGMTVGVIVGYVLRKFEDEGKLDKLCAKAGEFVDSTKKNIKDVVDAGVNEVEYFAERFDAKVEEVLDKD